jgi:hypothetical protein
MLLPIKGSEKGGGASSLKGFLLSAHKMFFRVGRFYEPHCVFSSFSGGDRANLEGMQKTAADHQCV